MYADESGDKIEMIQRYIKEGKRLKPEDYPPDLSPLCVDYIEIYFDLACEDKLTYQEIQSFVTLTGRYLSPWEIHMIRMIDAVNKRTKVHHENLRMEAERAKSRAATSNASIRR